MKLFIVILLINLVYLFGDKFGNRIHKKQLRGMYKEEQDKFTLKTFETTFDNLYYQIIYRAKSGQNEYHFTIMCQEEYISKSACEIMTINRDERWSQNHPYITNKQFAINVINALHQTFPDSNITQIYKNCCDYYIMEW